MPTSLIVSHQALFVCTNLSNTINSLVESHRVCPVISILSDYSDSPVHAMAGFSPRLMVQQLQYTHFWSNIVGQCVRPMLEV